MSRAPSVVLLDALGTLVGLEPPGPRLGRLLAERHGVRVGAEQLARGLGAEMAYYREHCSGAADADSLLALRRSCAGVLAAELNVALTPEELLPTLLDALVFRAYPDAEPALGALRARGARVGVVSNWDVSLHDVLAGLGLAVDVVITSAEQGGVSKPRPEIFGAALARLGARAADAVHVGDSVREDVGGALAAGVEPILLVRADDPLVGAVARDGTPPADVRVVGSLEELA